MDAADAGAGRVIALIAALKVLPRGEEERAEGGHDLIGAVLITASMLLLVFTVVQAPQAGWTSAAHDPARWSPSPRCSALFVFAELRM